ncbi:MAG: cob(I)yrinic acid a,c-diamide adenosyltransferase [Planctomycetota bacterium]|jgi:cob(I)alamin adenosyltransferase
MALYTGSGDDGSTGLFGGDRVGKEHPRVEAYGTVDELNAWIGMAAAACDHDRPTHAKMLSILTEAQRRLMDLGAELAAPADGPHRDKTPSITADHVKSVEAAIDEIDAGNEPLREFILPGGTELAARLHAARTVCRRAERRIVVVARIGPLSRHVIVYVNRLGDLLFAMARRANADAGVPDVMWKQGPDKP